MISLIETLPHSRLVQMMEKFQFLIGGCGLLIWRRGLQALCLDVWCRFYQKNSLLFRQQEPWVQPPHF